jgi:hypothetical protein
MIEGLSMVIEKYHGVDKTVYDEEADKKKTREAHRNFFPYGCSEKLFPGHIEGVDFEFGNKFTLPQRNSKGTFRV